MKSMDMARGAARRRSRGFLGALLFVGLALVAGSAEAGPRKLFGDVPGRVAADARHRPTDMRMRRVKMDLSTLADPGLPGGTSSVLLNLFPDANLTAVKSRFEHRGTRGFTWFGKVEGDPVSSVVLTSAGGLMRGLVFAQGRHFEIRGASAATQEVVEIDQSAFPPEGCDQIPAGNRTQTEIPTATSQDALGDTGEIIDVLVVYTPAVRTAEGGTAAAQLLAQNSIDSTNSSYANSNVTPRLNLVHAAEVSYTESADTLSGWLIDLDRLEGTADTYMDDVHALRDSYRADAVVLLVNNESLCGLADAIMASASTAFGLVARNCSTSNYSFAHEIGHLQGARHDMYADPTLGSPYDYNHGHVNLAARKRTVMAYNDECENKPPYTFCTRLPYWSNPDVDYPLTGVPTGTASRENNALVLNNTAATVARFRESTIPWVGSVSITSDKNVVAVGRPHIGGEVASYDGFPAGALSAYLPMLFKNAFGGSYNSAFYINNLQAANTANLVIKYYDSAGSLSCTVNDTAAPLGSNGYWMPNQTCLPIGWVGGVVVTSDQPIVAIGRPHIGGEVMAYNGFSSGSTTSYLPMLFKDAFGGSYDSAFYVQNVQGTGTAHLEIKYYDSTGALNCTVNDTVAPLASKGYWVPNQTCLPSGWVGGVVVTSDQPIVTIGRPHVGAQITTYNGFPSGAFSSYVPMLFKGAFGGSYDSAFYVQNVDATTTATIAIEYHDSAGTLNCTVNDSVAPLASRGYWVPNQACLPAGWVGGVVVTSDHPVVAVGRPHIGGQVTAYGGFPSGNLSSYLPMLFNNAFGGSYNSAFYIQNTEASAASVTIKFYDSSGALTCTLSDTIPGLANLGLWLPNLTCFQW